MKKYQDFRENDEYNLLLQGEKDKGFQAALAGADKYETAYKDLHATIEAKRSAAQKRYEDARTTYASGWKWVLGGVLGGVLLGQGIGYIIARLIATPPRNTEQVLACLDISGDLGFPARPLEERNQFVVLQGEGAEFALCVDKVTGIRRLARARVQKAESILSGDLTRYASGVLKEEDGALFLLSTAAVFEAPALQPYLLPRPRALRHPSRSG